MSETSSTPFYAFAALIIIAQALALVVMIGQSS